MVADQWLQPGAKVGNDPDIVHLVGTWLLTGSPTLLQDFLSRGQP
ncbi:hypothetical protein [Kitasatospora fiedleri]|nr:hypothetical protein [Kitasatospora fiedleri]